MSKFYGRWNGLLAVWHARKARLAHWFWLLFGYFLSQAAIQAMAFFSGIIVIRSLSKDDYALYTIINTMWPVITILSDNGITFGLLAVGGKIWEDDVRMGRLVRTGLDLRRFFGVITILVVSPVMVFVLLNHHAAPGLVALLMASVWLGSWMQLTSGVMKVVIELRQQIARLRNIGVAAGLFRFALIAGLACFLLNAWLATLASTAAAVMEAWLFVRVVRAQVSWQAPPEPEYRKIIMATVRKTAPLTIYFCLQSQVSIWLISIFGKTQQVADIGALSRLGLIFTVLGSTYSAIAVPRFARQHGRERLLVQFWQTVGSYGVILAAIIVAVKIFPEPLLFILGAKYANLGGLVWLVVASTGLASLSGLLWGLGTSRGWVIPAYVFIPVEISVQIILLTSLNLTVSRNVLMFSALSAIAPVALNFWYVLRRVGREES